MICDQCVESEDGQRMLIGALFSAVFLFFTLGRTRGSRGMNGIHWPTGEMMHGDEGNGWIDGR